MSTDPAAPASPAPGLFLLASNPHRFAVLEHLAGAPLTPAAGVGEAVGVAQNPLSHHLALLSAGGLVEYEKAGKQRLYQLTDLGAALMQAAAFVAEAVPAPHHPKDDDGRTESEP